MKTKRLTYQLSDLLQLTNQTTETMTKIRKQRDTYKCTERK